MVNPIINGGNNSVASRLLSYPSLSNRKVQILAASIFAYYAIRCCYKLIKHLHHMRKVKGAENALWVRLTGAAIDDRQLVLADCLEHADRNAYGRQNRLLLRSQLLLSSAQDEQIKALVGEIAQAGRKGLNSLWSLLDDARLHQILKAYGLSTEHPGDTADLMAKHRPAAATKELIAQVREKLKRRLPEARAFLKQLPDIFVDSLALDELTKVSSSENYSWAGQKYRIVKDLVWKQPWDLFRVVTTFIDNPLVAVAVTIGIIITWIGSLVTYKAHRPCPEQIPFAENYIRWAEQGRIKSGGILEREEILSQLVQWLCELKTSTRDNPILVGPSGVGKTEIVKALACRIADRHESIPEEIHGVKIFFISTAALGADQYPSARRKLQDILDKIQGYEQEVVLFLDEIHNAEDKLGEMLKPLLSDGRIHVIGATTNEELHKINNNSAFMNRFNQEIHVPELSDDCIRSMLRERIIVEMPSVLLDDGAIDTLMKHAKGLVKAAGGYEKASLLSKANTLLNAVMRRIRSEQSNPVVQDELKQKRSALAAHEWTYVRARGKGTALNSKEGQAWTAKHRELSEQIDLLEAPIKQQREKLLEFSQLQRAYHSWELRQYQVASTMSLEKQRDTQRFATLARNFFTCQAMVAILDELVLKKAKELTAVPVAMDSKLVTAVAEGFATKKVETP